MDSCPRCGHNEIDWFSRITGYYQNVSGWNSGKREELRRRHRHLEGSVSSFTPSTTISPVKSGQTRTVNGIRVTQ